MKNVFDKRYRRAGIVTFEPNIVSTTIKKVASLIPIVCGMGKWRIVHLASWRNQTKPEIKKEKTDIQIKLFLHMSIGEEFTPIFVKRGG